MNLTDEEFFMTYGPGSSNPEEQDMADYMTSMAVRTQDEPLDVKIVGDTRGTKDELTSMRSFNNRLVVEPYQKGALQSTVTNGFAFITQKVTVKGLTVLMDAKLEDGTFVPKGSIAYIKEESLHTQPWAQKVLESDTLGVPFIIVDLANVEFISPPPNDAA